MMIESPDFILEVSPPEKVLRSEVIKRFKILEDICKDYSESNKYLVTTYQQFLHLSGYGQEVGDVDGLYGSKTENALNTWLSNNYLPSLKESPLEMFSTICFVG